MTLTTANNFPASNETPKHHDEAKHSEAKKAHDEVKKQLADVDEQILHFMRARHNSAKAAQEVADHDKAIAQCNDKRNDILKKLVEDS